MTDRYASVVKKPLHAWVMGKNKWLQLVLVASALVAAFMNVLPVEMQKRIVDNAIKANKIDLLVWYCGIYLAAITASTMLKYLISILQTVIGQRTLCRMRTDLYRHLLKLPLSFYRKTQSGLVVSALSKELATAGDYCGIAISVPATNLLLLGAFGVYLFWLNSLLAVISLTIYPLVLLLVPILQKRVNTYNRKRIDSTRRMSSKLGESIDGIHEIQANGAFSLEENKFHALVQQLKRIRIIWNVYRYAVKRVNSLFTNLGRFLVFAVGGYLAIHGRLELGSLVAFLSAQDKLYDPWKELIEFYQANQIARLTYNRTMDYFDEKPEHATRPSERRPFDLKGNIDVAGLSMVTEEGARLLSDIHFSLSHGEHLAIVGFSGSGKSTLANCIGQLQKYTGGQIQIDQKEVSSLSKSDIAKNIGYVSQKPFIFEGTIEENLIYGLSAMGEDENGREMLSMPNRDDKILMLQQTGLFADVLRFGSDTILDPEQHEPMIGQILQVRDEFRAKHKDALSEYIEFYDRDNYLHYSTVIENIIFGEARCAAYAVENLPQNDFFKTVLAEAGLTAPLIGLGQDLTREMIRHFHDPLSKKALPEPDLMGTREIGDYEKILHRIKTKGASHIEHGDRNALLAVALRYIPKKHTFVRFPEELPPKILEARKRFEKMRTDGTSGDIAPCHISNYLFEQSILTNIIFGKIKDDSAEARQRINTLIYRFLIEKEFMEEIVEMGMQYSVGSKGDNLSGGQKQKLAIARAFLKRPPIFIMDEATASLDNESQARIQDQIENSWQRKSTLIGIVHRLDTISNYDRIAVMKGGKIVEMGTYDGLMEKRQALFELARGKAGA